MADGSVKIDVGLNTSKADKELSKLTEKITQAEEKLSERSSAKSELEAKLEKAKAEAESTKGRIEDITEAIREMEASLRGDQGSIEYSFEDFVNLPNDIAQAKQELEEAEKLLKEQDKTVAKLYGENEKLGEKLETERKSLEAMKADAGELARIAETTNQTDSVGEIKTQIDGARQRLTKFVKQAVGIASVAVLFRKLSKSIVSSVLAFAESDETTKRTIEELKAALDTLKLSWGAAFAPILNAVAPLLQTLIGWITSAANAIARFIAILSGKNTYKKAVVNNNNLSKSIGGVGAAAEETKKQLAGFDELEILSGDSPSGGGGGGVGSSAAELIEELANAGDNSFLSRLALAVRDVFFDWGDWNAEKILAKAIALCPALAGAYLGWNIGGFKGAVIGGIAGLLLGLIIDANTFNFDGKISKDEVIKLAIQAIPALAGLVTGMLTGNPIVGITVGLALSFYINRNLIGSEGHITESTLKRLIFNAIPTLAGLFADFATGNPVIGIVVAIALKAFIDKNLISSTDETTELSFKSLIISAIPGLAGLVIGVLTGNPLIGVSVAVALTFLVDSISGSGNETETGWIEKIRSALHFPSDEQIYAWCRKWFWTDGVKAFFVDAFAFLTGGQITETTIDNWIEAIRAAINFPVSGDIVAWMTDFFWENGIKAFFVDLYSLITGQTWTGGTDAGKALSDRVIEGLNSIGEKLQAWWDEKVAPWFTWEKWKTLGANAMSAIKEGILSLSFPSLKFEMSSLSWEYNVWPFGRGTLSIPWPSISWAARGGIVDGLTPLIAGEAGKEAIVPLERNTEWIGLVANGLMERLQQSNFANRMAEAFASVPMPAMAGGHIAPPNAMSAAYGGGFGNSLIDEIKALRSEINALASQPVQVNSKLYMDRREVGKGVTEFQRQQSRTGGY